MSAVLWVNRSGIPMRMLGRLEIMNRWCHIAKHIPGVDDIQAHENDRWPKPQVQQKIQNITGSASWVEQDIGDRGRTKFELILRYRFADTVPDKTMWNLMSGSNHYPPFSTPFNERY